MLCLEEAQEQIHKVMTSLSAKHVQNLENVYNDLAHSTTVVIRLEGVFDINS